MKGHRILFFDRDPKVCRVAERALLATQSEVTLADSEAAVMAAAEREHFDLYMVNFDPPANMDERWGTFFDRLAQTQPKARVVLHATAHTEDYLPLMQARRYVRNLIAKDDEPLDPDELIVTAGKILRRDAFGLDKYLLWGVEPYRVEIADSRDKARYIGQVTEYAHRLGVSERVVDLIATIVDELVMNAIYNAPRDAAGNAKYAKLPRRETVVLEPHERGSLEFACDGSHIAIAQSDPFGALTHETIVDYLNRCLVKGPNQMSEATGGAGLGLYKIFQSLSKFIINIEPGKKTEVITILDLRLSMKQFRSAPKSFHIFMQE